MSETSVLQKRKRRARKAGLTYVNDFDSGFTRRRCGRGFTYVDDNGETIDDQTTRRRIDSLVIPPAWRDVWISDSQWAHIQARGVDEDGRPQYLYHEAWKAASKAAKFDRMSLMAELLPRIRRRVRRDLSGDDLGRDRVIATVVRLLDKVHLRIGNQRYFDERGTRGATTLSEEHVNLDEFRISLDFPGKSGKRRQVDFSDQKVAAVISQCEEIDGQFLFGYLDESGNEHDVSSSTVNDYLREISGESLTAKDFRTWWGSVIALGELADLENDASEVKRKSACVAAVKTVARDLGNTVAVCRQSYIHPAILSAAQSGELPKLLANSEKTGEPSRRELTIDENRFANLLPHLDFT